MKTSKFSNLTQDIQLQTTDGQPFDIPVSGSLGLLALGDIGVLAWRRKRREMKEGLARKSRQNLQNN